jgi:3-oxoacyl-[acyl-carrier protein] reductase
MLKNKNILITGAGKGIGLSILEKCINNSGFVYAVTRSKSDLKKYKSHHKVKIYYGDVKNYKLIDKIFKDSILNKKIINCLVNNAGERQRIKFKSLTIKKFKYLFENNFFSIFYITQKFFLNLIKLKKKGSIVNIGSIVGNIGFNELVGYGSAKAALIGFTKCCAAEISKHNIRVNCINPGFIKTSYFQKFKKKKLYNWTLSRIPMKRWGTPEEISEMVVFLLSEKSNYINGEVINIDGGWLAS